MDEIVISSGEDAEATSTDLNVARDKLISFYKEIPSIPSVTFRFKTGIHNNLLTNWKVPTDFLNPPQTNKKRMKGIDEKLRATIFINFCCSGFIKINKKIPINGIKDM